jgi:hypothetical protein
MLWNWLICERIKITFPRAAVSVVSATAILTTFPQSRCCDMEQNQILTWKTCINYVRVCNFEYINTDVTVK